MRKTAAVTAKTATAETKTAPSEDKDSNNQQIIAGHQPKRQ